jgi:hypothetical protein
MTPEFWPCTYNSKLLEVTISLKPPLSLTKPIVKVFLCVCFHMYYTLLGACITLPPLTLYLVSTPPPPTPIVGAPSGG